MNTTKNSARIGKALAGPVGSGQFTIILIAACARHIRAIGRFGLKNGDIDRLVLGCTHYPFAAEALRSLVGPDVQFIATGEAVARQTRRLLPAPAASTRPLHVAPGGIRLLPASRSSLKRPRSAG